MIAYGENIQVFCGNSNPQFAQTICKELGVPMGKAIVTHFADGEASVTLEETVRGADVFLIQSTCKPVNDNLMELLVMIDACRRASAGRITAVIPYFGYARQDRKAKSRDPISAKLVANMLTAAGAGDVLIQVDGGACPENTAQLVAAGADVLVSGSAFFGHPPYDQCHQKFQAAAQAAADNAHNARCAAAALWQPGRALKK